MKLLVYEHMMDKFMDFSASVLMFLGIMFVIAIVLTIAVGIIEHKMMQEDDEILDIIEFIDITK